MINGPEKSFEELRSCPEPQAIVRDDENDVLNATPGARRGSKKGHGCIETNMAVPGLYNCLKTWQMRVEPSMSMSDFGQLLHPIQQFNPT